MSKVTKKLWIILLLPFIGCKKHIHSYKNIYYADESKIDKLPNLKKKSIQTGIDLYQHSGVINFHYPYKMNGENDAGIKINKLNGVQNINVIKFDQISNPNLEIIFAKCKKKYDKNLDEGGNPIGERCTHAEFANQHPGSLYIINSGFYQ